MCYPLATLGQWYCVIMLENKKTIKKEVSFSGKALQTGEEVHVVCKPARPGLPAAREEA
jgi:hypothetical protein